MSFDQPWGLSFSLLLPAIIILYLLKLKRVDTPISSILLWRRSLQDLKANTPFQKLRRNLLLFLQLLATAIGVFALMAPILSAINPERESLIVLLDNSASMGATDVEPNRLEKAKSTVRGLIDGLGRGDAMTLITFANEARVEVPLTDRRRQLLSALEEVRVQPLNTDLSDAFGLAYAAAKEAKFPRIVLVTDGAFETELESVREEIPTQLIAVGGAGTNVGLTELAVRQGYEDDAELELLVGVSAVGNATGEVYLSVYALDDGGMSLTGGAEVADATNVAPAPATDSSQERRLVDARRVGVRPGKTTSVVLRDPGSYSNVLELVLDSDDDLALDNRAWVVLPTDETLNVLLVSDGYYALERVLPLSPGTRVSRVNIADYKPVGGVDVTIFDRHRPEELGHGSHVFLGEIPPLEGCSRGDILEYPHAVWTDRFHPLTRYVNFDAISIQKAPVIALPPWANIVVRARETPMVATLERGPMAAVVVGFHPLDTDWPFRVSFPIFFSNVLDWFRTRGGTRRTLYRTGEPVPLVSHVAGEIKATLPDGSSKTLPLQANESIYIAGLAQTGLLTLDGPRENERRLLAVNLASHAESNITSGKSLRIGDVVLEAETAEEITSHNLWWSLLLLVLIVMTIEWWVYTRRARYTF